MLKNIIFFLTCLCVWSANAQTTEELLARIHGNTSTECATNTFINALIAHADETSETAPEYAVRAWASKTMSGADVLEQILQCPEIKSADDYTTIVFSPIEYQFPSGRTITINYSTQPKVLKQKLILSRKRSLPNGDANPDLMSDTLDGGKYLNTEPAWYAIMVVQHDSLSEFVGPGKNNTLSMEYLNNHIDEIYPHGYWCTSKSAWANDKDTINQVVKKVIDLDDDSNDYYVAGDINLEWVMYAEIAADIIITVVTMGAGQAAMGAVKGVRATKTAKQLIKNIKALEKLDDVKKYMNVTRKIAHNTDNIAKLEKEIDMAKNATKNINKLEKEITKAKKAGKDFSKMEQEIQNIKNAEKSLEKNEKTVKELREASKNLNKEADQMAKQSDNVKKYKESTDAFSDVMKYRRGLRALTRPQTGNVITRALKSLKAANTGAKDLSKAGKVARAGMSSRSAKAKYWLTDATLKHGSRLARFERDAGLLYGAVSFLGDMYDNTSSTSKEFSNGIEFKPFCLLSADDIKGQENVVNYGMWLMWVGNSMDDADDDAAYLQAMDFASKFFYQLDEFQDEHTAHCNVDIYVVRPIIRLDETNVENPSGELFYLFMNEIPWSTAEQFNDAVPNIQDWERTQAQLQEQDPHDKQHRKTQSEDTEPIADDNTE